MANQEESPLFVGITNNGELRRNMLECSKEILESLKHYEKFKFVKEEKQKLIQKFREDVKGLSKLISRLKTNLPKVKEIGIKKTEFEKLEAELNDIESKLNGLS